jgi:hypothetical protein
MIDKLTITLIRKGNETEDMNIALNSLACNDAILTAQSGSSGLIRDDDGVVAYWEWDVA